MIMQLTPKIILAIAPNAKPLYVEQLVRDQWLFTQYKLTTPSDMARFLGQIMTETQGLTRLEENLYYTTTARLRAVWPSRFKSNAAAQPYVRNPQALANLVYGGRLGNTLPNDGWEHRGSGTPHLTGFSNYQMVSRETGTNVTRDNASKVREFPMALEAGLVFWSVNNLARFTDIKALTKAWQGGDGGLADRITYTNRAVKALKGQTTDAVAAPPSFTILCNGMPHSEAVKSLQQRLQKLGYDVGLVDGWFGDATERALRDFQRVFGLVQDGVYGPKTEAALLVALNGGKGKNPDQPSGLERLLMAFANWLASLTRA